jgi:glycerophosphoryl diester phosphodiesterase
MLLRLTKLALRLVLTLYVGALLVAFVLEPEPLPSHPFFDRDTAMPLVIAHRRGPELGPESTLYTYNEVAELGVEVLEMDVHTTVDGHLMVAHDSRVDRITNGSGRIAEMTLAEIRALDAGFHWTPDGETYPMRSQGIMMPTVIEMFAAFREKRFVIELKSRSAQTARDLCAAVSDHNLQDRVAVTSFADDALEAFREECPGVLTSATAGEVAIFWALHTLRLDDLYASTPFSVFMVPIDFGPLNVVDERFAETCHERNIALQVWTIDEPEQMRWLIRIGADGIMTDRPTLLLDLLSEVAVDD